MADDDLAQLGDIKLDDDAHDAFFNDGSVPDAPAEDLLKVMKNWSHEYAQSLNEMREALSATVSEAWGTENDVVAIDTEPRDSEHILRMVNTDNQQLNKVIMVFTALVTEMKQLSNMARDKFYGPLSMFGHQVEHQQKVAAEDRPKPPEHQMGAFMPFLQDLSNFVKRCYAITRNTVNQLACLYHERQKLYLSTFKHCHLPIVFDALGGICRLLLTFDAIIEDNTAIGFGWTAYKKMIKYVRADPDRYGVDAAKLRTFESMLLLLDRNVTSAKLFEGLLNQDFGLQGQNSKALVAGNRVLAEEFAAVIKLELKRIASELTDQTESQPREQLVNVVSLYVLYRRLFKATTKVDKKLFAGIWELQRKVPLVPLAGRAIWMIPEFLLKYAAVDASLNPPPSGLRKAREEFLTKHDEDFSKTVEELYHFMCTWMVRMETDSVPGPTRKIADVMSDRGRLLLNGMLLINQVRNLVTVSIHLHLHLEMPFRARNVRSLAICSEMLKAMESVFNGRVAMIAENVSHLLAQAAYMLRRVFKPIKEKLDKRTRLDDTKLDVLAAVNLTMSLLDRVPSEPRRNVLHLALSVAQLKNMLKQNHTDEVRFQLWKIDLLSSWQNQITHGCNCDFLYWVSNLVPAFFSDIQKHPDQVHRLPHLFNAFRDPTRLLKTALETGPYLVRSYQAEVLNHFEEMVANPIAREVETDLRLHIHSVVLHQENLRKTDVKDLSKKTEVKDLSRYLLLKPLYFFDKKVDLKLRVTHYLDSTFYNLTTVALHDWKVYAEMRNLASEKYGLKLTEVHLPGASHYSDALDVLEIMRNIHIFVARYNYNMNTQVFVERAYDQKHLNIINISQIAHSIRTHGTGIMNTTVNFTYQFLVRKFQLFSEFLFDDHIKSRLIKDIRFFRAEKESLDNKYPFERTEKFNKDIRKLGVTEEGLTFLDQFRQQITEIGNALGYVRMVRSGGLHHTSNAIKFVPDLEGIPSFSELIAKDVLPAETKDAAKNLDRILEELSGGFAEGTEYFQILVKIFQPVLSADTHSHLRNFFVIGPPLMLNFVEKMIGQKEKLNKKSGKFEAAFTDDGFALGLAYILKLLDQDAAFDSLYWFDSVRVFIRQRQQELAKASSTKKPKAPKDEEEANQIQLSTRRLESLAVEFELLYFSFCGARIFFKDLGEDLRKKKAQEEKLVAGEKPQDPLEAAGAEPAAAPPPQTGAGVPPPPAPPPLVF